MSHALVLPRALIFFASIWLIGAWTLAIGLVPPVHPSSSSYEYGLQMMILCMTTGMMIGWPLLRLSQVTSAAPIRQTLLDLVVLVSLVQIVLWPLRLVTTWSVLRTASIDATLVGWLFLAGAVVGAAIGSDRAGPRNLGMIACIGMCLLGPAIALSGIPVGLSADRVANLSPLMSIRAIGEAGAAPVTAEEWSRVIVLGSAALGTWMALIVWKPIARRLH